MLVINSDGAKEEFQDEKLYDSAYYAALEAELSEEKANDLAEKVVWEVKSWISDHEHQIFSTQEVREKAMEVMKRENEDAAFMYETHLKLN